MIKVPCDVYSRVVGYFQPVRMWNNGKAEEWKYRAFIQNDNVMETIKEDDK
jgi:anaerobic ribonucleoside-triphosphate reductase